MESEITITERVKSFLKEKNLSTTAFAKALNMGQTTISKQLRQGKISTSVLAAMLEAYPELSAEYLMRGVKPSDVETIDMELVNRELQDCRDQLKLMQDVIKKLL